MSNVVFDEQSHTYTVDGVKLPSVTHIIRFLHYDTAVNAKPWLRDIAANRGSRIHAYTAMLDYGEPLDELDIDFDCIGYVKAYRRFLEDYKPQWCGIETVLGNLELGYAGTCDRYGEVDGLKTILDIKTGSMVHGPSVAAQIEGYWHLLHREKGFSANNYAVLLLNKDGTYKYIDRLEDDFQILFDECLEIHKALNRKGVAIR